MTDTRKKIHQKIVELAKELGHDAHSLKNHDSIPASGFLDSPARLDLTLWFENETGLEFDHDQLNAENFGSIDAMVHYVEKARR